MNKKIVMGYVVALLACAGVAFAASQIFHSGTWRYKMTVSVETPEGIKSGSAVREVYVRQNPKITPESLPHIEVRGEAVAVDLGARGVLFALLKGPMSQDHAHMVVYETVGGGLSPEGIEYLEREIGRKAVLTPKDYPLLVTFTDLNDPKTVTQVMEIVPTSIGVRAPWRIEADRFEELFGEGVRLHEISIEIVDEPITWTIEKYLKWLKNRKNIQGYLGSSPPDTSDPTGLYLNGIEFSKGKLW